MCCVCLRAVLLPSPLPLAPLLTAPPCTDQCCLQTGRLLACYPLAPPFLLPPRPLLPPLRNLLLLFVQTTANCRAAEVMREIFSLNLRPGVVVYTTLLNAYGVAGDLAAAHKVLHDMKAAGVQPNNFTYSSLMALHSQAGQVSRILVSLLCSCLHSVLYAFC